MADKKATTTTPTLLTSVKGRKVKLLQMAAGVDMIGSKSSMTSKTADITVVEEGFHCLSKDTGREVLIGLGNFKAAELLPE